MRGVVHRIPQPVSRPEFSRLLQAAPERGSLTRTGKNGFEVRCPACEEWRPLFDYIVLWISEKFADQVVAPMRCPDKQCRHVFALHPDPPGRQYD